MGLDFGLVTSRQTHLACVAAKHTHPIPIKSCLFMTFKTLRNSKLQHHHPHNFYQTFRILVCWKHPCLSFHRVHFRLILTMSNGSFSRYIFDSSMCLTSEAIFTCPTLNPFSDRRKFMLFSFSISTFWKFLLRLGNATVTSAWRLSMQYFLYYCICTIAKFEF
jgi:hypothetical protein